MIPLSTYAGLLERYRPFLIIDQNIVPVSLYEGNTPLLPLLNIPRIIKKDIRLFAKIEGANPTGSFKDRGMTAVITQAIRDGASTVVCASTGNTSASAAAYAAKAGIRCVVVIPENKIALGKLAQAMIYGAQVIQIKGGFDAAMELVKLSCDHPEVVLVNSVNPYRLQGQKTIAFEIVETLGDAPDYHYLPVGNAGNITAHWMGYCEAAGERRAYPPVIKDFHEWKGMQLASNSSKMPVMVGYQACGAAPFVDGGPIASPETIATAIRIGRPQSWDYAIEAVDQSKGWFAAQPDAKILAAQKMLATCEGVFCEPASAVSLAGLLDDLSHNKITAGSTVVMTLTGNGLKDPQICIDTVDVNTIKSIKPVKAELEPFLI